MTVTRSSLLRGVSDDDMNVVPRVRISHHDKSLVYYISISNGISIENTNKF